MMQGYFILGDEEHVVQIQAGSCLADGREIQLSGNILSIGGVDHPVETAREGNRIWVHWNGSAHQIVWYDAVTHFAQGGTTDTDLVSRAPMPGSVVQLLVAPGDKVNPGEVLLVIESMKLETSIRAAAAGTVSDVHVALGENFQRDATLVTLVAED